MTVWQWLKDDWAIKKNQIKEIGINPDKEHGEITLNELRIIADYLGVWVADLV